MRKTLHWLGQIVEDTVQEQLRTDLEFSLWREEVEQLWAALPDEWNGRQPVWEQVIKLLDAKMILVECEKEIILGLGIQIGLQLGGLRYLWEE